MEKATHCVLLSQGQGWQGQGEAAGRKQPHSKTLIRRRKRTEIFLWLGGGEEVVGRSQLGRRFPLARQEVETCYEPRPAFGGEERKNFQGTAARTPRRLSLNIVALAGAGPLSRNCREGTSQLPIIGHMQTRCSLW